MMTPEEIKAGLAYCMDEIFCPGCPVEQKCEDTILSEARALIEQLEKKVSDAEAAIQEKDRIIDLMKEQLRGACRVCKYNETGDYIRCKECCDDEFVYHPLWEYEGLPGA